MQNEQVVLTSRCFGMSLFWCLVIFVGLVKAFIYRVAGILLSFVLGGMCAKTTANWSDSTSTMAGTQILRNLCFFPRHLQPVVVVVVGFLVASPRAGMQQILTHRWLQSRDRLSWM